MGNNKKIIVAIDGYSSCGKSTMAKALARKVGYVYVDTGAMYRAVALFAMRQGLITPDKIDEAGLQQVVGNIKIDFRPNAAGGQDTYLNDENVESQIRTLEVADGASRVSTLGFVRRELVRQQQRMGLERGIVMDGRDIGTVVFPDAELKLFLTARPEVRAQRRFDELRAKGLEADFDRVLAEVNERDYRDTHRAESPLRQAADAVVLDNSDLTPAQQDERLAALFAERTSK
jgi:CMP/dCMP kinase